MSDDFETGTFSTDWSTTTGPGTAVIHDPGGAAGGSDRYARIEGVTQSSSGGLGVSLADLAVGSQVSSDFTASFDFRLDNTTNQQLAFSVSGLSSVPNANLAALDLKYQDNAWSAFDGSAWQTLAGLGSVTSGTWNSLSVSGSNWGEGLGGSADYDISYTDHLGTNTSADGLRIWKTNHADTIGARSLSFNDLSGNNPGWDIDNVNVTATPGFPPPTSSPPRITTITVNPTMCVRAEGNYCTESVH